jgi:catenin alpha
MFIIFFQVRAARNLLSAVTRLLILADMIDVHLLLKKLRRVEDDIEHLVITVRRLDPC